MSGALLAKAGKLLIGGKFHWRTALTAFAGYNLLAPRARMNPAFNQMSMYGGMGGMGMGGMGMGGMGMGGMGMGGMNPMMRGY